MAPLFIPDIKPFSGLSAQVCPQALTRSVNQIFSLAPEKLMLVGGTALAGYYAEHRRSDDLDLFAGSEPAFDLAIRAVRTLKKEGARLSSENRTSFYYRCQVDFLSHAFTIDVVLDENIHHIGSSHITGEGVRVASVPTLFAMKIACLVSRCSEKDLYDLAWILKHAENFEIKSLIAQGQSIDAGVTSESLLYSLQSASLRAQACDFLPLNSKITATQVFNEIEQLKKFLIKALTHFEMKGPLPDEAKKLKLAMEERKKLK